VYRDWLVNLRDWCISRQLWWGHQIPAWYVVSETGGEITDQTPFVVAATLEAAQTQATAQYGVDIQLCQDPDVLDTWFSSGLWPFSTMGWPAQTTDLAKYYPTTTLVTGFDIIFFWVARMTLMAGHFTEQMPFQTVYIHGLVRDENNKKMSKSANNGIDPLVLINQYGTDALRYTLIKEVAGAGQDISLRLSRQLYELKIVQTLIAKIPAAELTLKLQNHLESLKNKEKSLPDLFKLLQNALKVKAAKSQGDATFSELLQTNLEELEKTLQARESLSESVEASRNFANKLWNASRFVMLNLDQQTPTQLGIPGQGTETLELADRWILSRYRHVVEQVRQQIEQYGLGESAKTLYEFIWGDLCDWYIELIKPRLRDLESPSRKAAQQTLAWVLEGTLRLLHPLMPHITEELWGTLTQATEGQFLATQAYPTAAELPTADVQLEAQFTLLIETIRTIRNLRAEADIKPGLKIPVILQTDSDLEYQILEAGQAYLQDIAKVETLTITRTLEAPARQTMVGVVETVQVLLPLAGVVDIAALKAKIVKDLGKVEAEIASLSARLDKPGFVDKAKPEVVKGAQDALAAAQKQAEILHERLAQLE
jgi:valyl-tRNA synthetase